MFAPCPHCGFLVAQATTRHNPKQRCPRCNEPLRGESAAKATKAKPEAATPSPSPVTSADASPDASAPTPTPDTRREPETEPRQDRPRREKPHQKPQQDEPQNTEPASSQVEPDSIADETTRSGKVATAVDEPDAIEPAPEPIAAPASTDTPVEPADADAGTNQASPPAPETTQFEDSIAAAALTPANARPAVPRRRAESRGMPAFARVRQPTTPRQRSWRGPAAIAALSMTLALQLLLAQRTELAAQARWRPLVAALCGVLRCELPPWHEPTAFTMLDRNVQPKAGVTGVLSVTASFRNDARWPQPWPTLVLSLSDVDGRQVGQRAFAPAEYRGTGTADLLAPGQSASVQLDVIEPAPRIVAFTFDFR